MIGPYEFPPKFVWTNVGKKNPSRDVTEGREIRFEIR